MIRIKIGKYTIDPFGKGWRVSIEKGLSKLGHMVRADTQYYTNIETMLKALPDRMAMRQSDAETLSELLRDMRSYQSEIEFALKHGPRKKDK